MMNAPWAVGECPDDAVVIWKLKLWLQTKSSPVPDATPPEVRNGNLEVVESDYLKWVR
jgi:hypothetical protein